MVFAAPAIAGAAEKFTEVFATFDDVLAVLIFPRFGQWKVRVVAGPPDLLGPVVHAVANPGGFPSSDQVIKDKAEFPELEQMGFDVAFNLVFDVSSVAVSVANGLQAGSSVGIGQSAQQLSKAMAGSLGGLVVPEVVVALFVGLFAGRVARAGTNFFVAAVDLPRPLAGGSEVYFRFQV